MFQKLIWVFIAGFLFQLVACSTATITFDPNTVSAEDKIGIWSTYSRTKAFSGLSDVFVGSLKEQKNDVLRTVHDLKLHDVVEERLLQRAPLVVNARYRTIDSKDVVVGGDNRPNLLATAKKLGLDKVVIVNTAPVISEKTINYQFYWQPRLEIRGEMLNVPDGKVLWNDEIVEVGRNIPRFEISGVTFDLILNGLALKITDRLMINMRYSNSANNDLHVSAGNGDLAGVKEEVSRGENVNSIDYIGQTALMYASEKGAIEIVKYLVENGADIKVKSDMRGRGTALIYASAANRVTVMEYLLKRGADINATTYNKETALFWAAAMGHVEAVKFLLSHNADTQLKNYKGKTALNLAEDLQRKEIEDMLKEQ